MNTRNLQVLIEELGNLILLRSRGNQKGLKTDSGYCFIFLLDIEFLFFWLLFSFYFIGGS